MGVLRQEVSQNLDPKKLPFNAVDPYLLCSGGGLICIAFCYRFPFIEAPSTASIETSIVFLKEQVRQQQHSVVYHQ